MSAPDKSGASEQPQGGSVLGDPDAGGLAGQGGMSSDDDGQEEDADDELED